MQTRRLGRSGPDVSTVGFGSWAVGGPYLFGWGPVDDAESIAAVRHAVEQGVTWVDTAPIYGLGHSEEVVGEALRPWRTGTDVLVFTKCGRPWLDDEQRIGFDLRPEAIRAECEESLRRLGVDRIDLYQVHWPDRESGTPLEESWATMAELVDEGKVRWIGVSNFDVDQLERCEAVRHVDTVQPAVSLLNRAPLDDVVPWCERHGTGVIAYAPMANGLLSGKYTRQSPPELAADDWRRRSPEFAEPRLSANLELVDVLHEVAADLGASVPDVAVAWVLAHRGITCAAVGARNPAQVKGWLRAGELDLAEDVVRRLDDAAVPVTAGAV